MAKNQHHEPFTALGLVDWEDVPQDDLQSFLKNSFTQAQTLTTSLPSEPLKAKTPTRSESSLDVADSQSTLPLPQSQESLEQAQQLRKEWKEVKVNTKENPLGITVYKLSGKDGKGAWFARRSVHEGLSFDAWKDGLDREFAETMKVQGSPGSGSIRGIGADKRVEHTVVDGVGQLDVFQLSAQFPGPTSPRDFITLLLSSDFSGKGSPPKGSAVPRQYMIVSKPCQHPECPPRQGIIRGQYESVEIIREVPSAGLESSTSSSPDPKERSSGEKQEDSGTAIEWIMITRSDPGGSVPRFMIEKGTPPGIAGDAAKFLKWLTALSTAGSTETEPRSNSATIGVEGQTQGDNHQVVDSTHIDSHGAAELPVEDETGVANRTGLYGIITGAFGAASSVVASGLRRQFDSSMTSEDSEERSVHSHPGEEADEKKDDLSDLSSVRSFASALEKSETMDKDGKDATGSHSDSSKPQSAHEKELKKLQERRRKLDEKVAKMQKNMEQKQQGDKEKDAASLAKAREKNEKEIAKREAKYKRELKKLEEKRESEERKAESRRRKTLEREEKANLSLELEKARVERDMARKHVQLLEGQVKDLQAQNMAMAAKMVKMEGEVGVSSSSELNLPEKDGGVPLVST